MKMKSKRKRKRKTLLILRHAKSSWNEPDLPDRDRPLNKRGKRDAPRMGEFLKEMDLVPDLIISSTAKRARDTAKAVAKYSKYRRQIILNNSLYGADHDDYLIALRLIPDQFDKVLIVGHNPTLEELVSSSSGKAQRMPTCALALVELDDAIKSWSNIGSRIEGRLVNVWRPRELGRY